MPRQVSLKFSELAGWIENESDQMFRELRSHIQRMYEGISEAIEELDNSKIQLINADFGEKVFKRLAKAGASNRDNLVKNLDIIKDRTVVPEDTDPAKALEFYTDTRALLNTSLENAIRSQQYVKALFPEQYKDIFANLKRFEGLLEELVAPINEERDKLEAYSKLPALIGQIQNTKSRIKLKKSCVFDLESECRSLREEREVVVSNLKDLEESEESVHANELETRVDALNRQVQSVDSQLSDMFAPLSKSLSRMEKQDESGRHTMSSQSRKVLKILNGDPVRVLGTDITPFLTEMKVRVEDGSLGLKQQKMNKTLEQIDRLVGTDVLLKLKSQREEYFSKLTGVQGELEELTVYKEKTQIEDKMSECRNMMDSTGQKLNAEKKDLARLKNEVEELKSGLDSDLSEIFGKDIEVVY
ncbi:MAG: hypothetical protein KAR85_07750 [Methanosarcinales archaeon]|nr:hypothetical protein [Methanosarcinales archaeon]